MSSTRIPNVKKYVDKEIDFKLNGTRQVSGILRGFDPFMNLVVDEAIETRKDGSSHRIGMIVIRGNSILAMEPRERVSQVAQVN